MISAAEPEARRSGRWRSLQLLALAIASGLLVAEGLRMPGPWLRYPATAVTTIHETFLDCTTAESPWTWTQSLYLDPDLATVDGALDEAIAQYAKTLLYDYPSHEALEARLAVLLCERGRFGEARTALKHLKESHWGFVHTIDTAYPGVLSDSAPHIPAFDPSVMEAVLHHDSERRWTLDRLEQRWASQTGDSERALRAEQRISDRAGRWQKRYELVERIDLGLLLAGIMSIVGLAALRSWRGTGSACRDSWAFWDGIAVIALGGFYWFVVHITDGFGLAYIPHVGSWYVVIVYLPLFWLIRRQLLAPTEESISSAFGLRLASIGWPALCAWALALAAVEQLAYSLILLLPLDSPWWEWWPEDELRGGTIGLVMGFTGSILWAPILEEVVFRGLVFGTLRMRLGGVNAAIISSWLFSTTHFYSPSGFLAIFSFGLIACFAYARTRSLLVPILFHALVNAQVCSTTWIGYRMP